MHKPSDEATIGLDPLPQTAGAAAGPPEHTTSPLLTEGSAPPTRAGGRPLLLRGPPRPNLRHLRVPPLRRPPENRCLREGTSRPLPFSWIHWTRIAADRSRKLVRQQRDIIYPDRSGDLVVQLSARHPSQANLDKVDILAGLQGQCHARPRLRASQFRRHRRGGPRQLRCPQKKKYSTIGCQRICPHPGRKPVRAPRLNSHGLANVPEVHVLRPVEANAQCAAPGMFHIRVEGYLRSVHRLYAPA